jgi:voltage-gated potassium channel Kch
MESSNLGFAFSKAFSLIKNNWWSTFGVQAIMLILVIAAGFIFYIPLAIAGIGSFFAGIGKMDTVGVIIKVVVSHITMVFLVFPNIALALSYYSLSEQKDGTGLIDRIRNFGKTESAYPDLAPEEY